ncbi:hypothetical protein [Dyella acidiphila]|uniref:PH domain-containing protein n=1 Tax=Dyella acidiphila TaxID=2775866 RepID=A0ABR9G9U3_9GAMM|nr:hypothetical protein [Dyella acidiphila]MBE1160805.1 hypothetical protein [Dyella acidiphila]
MHFFWLTAFVVGFALSIVRLYSNREQSDECAENRFFMTRAWSYIMIFMAIAGLCMAAAIYFGHFGHPKEDAFPGLALSAGATLCALVWSCYEVRLEPSALRFGLLARRSLHYESIAKIVEIRNEKSPRAILVTVGGKKVGIWSNLSGFDVLMRRLADRCPGASHERVGRA